MHLHLHTLVTGVLPSLPCSEKAVCTRAQPSRVPPDTGGPVLSPSLSLTRRHPCYALTFFRDLGLQSLPRLPLSLVDPFSPLCLPPDAARAGEQPVNPPANPNPLRRTGVRPETAERLSDSQTRDGVSSTTEDTLLKVDTSNRRSPVLKTHHPFLGRPPGACLSLRSWPRRVLVPSYVPLGTGVTVRSVSGTKECFSFVEVI